MVSPIGLTIAIFLISFPCLSSCFLHINPILMLITGAGTAIFSVFIGYQSGFPGMERCDQSWTNFSSTNFYAHLQEHLYGQHLVAWVVTKSLKAHIKKVERDNALVMSFHGWTGSGKNYATKMIVNALYSKGPQSEFVHWYIGTRDFPHISESEQYSDRLRKEIPEYTKRCDQSIFIFDEMDKMPPGIIDAIKPFIDSHDYIDGVDYKKNIFIFLSNAGGSEITRVAFNFWLDGKDRKDIDMRDIEPLINQGAFNEIGGLQYSEIVKNNLIDVYVPFLPLERIHVKKCIVQELEMRRQAVKDELIDTIANQIVYYPPQFELFSVSGCKKISHKVDLYATDI